MLEIFVIAFCLYFIFNTYTSFMQIGFIKNAKNLKPIILDSSKYQEAGNYAIEKEKLAICSSFYDFILFGFFSSNRIILVKSCCFCGFIYRYKLDFDSAI